MGVWRASGGMLERFCCICQAVWENQTGQLFSIQTCISILPLHQGKPQPAFRWVMWRKQQISRSAPVLVGFLMPVCHRQRTVCLMDGLTANGGNMHLVASTKKRNQKLSYRDLLENLYSINFRDTFAEILYLEGGWAMLPFNYYS